jgi:hypothetical protein
VLARLCCAIAAKSRPHRLQGHLVERALLVVQRFRHAVDLLGGQHIGAELRFKLGEAAVVAFLEGFEGRHEVAEGSFDIVAAYRLDLGRGRHCCISHVCSFLG